MTYRFSNIDSLKRDRRIEGETGIDVKLTADIFLVCLAASDANPRWNTKAEKAFAEIKRLRNAGYPDTDINARFAKLFADTIVIGWHGGYDEDGNRKPGGPKDEAGEIVPFSVEACAAFLAEADDAQETILGIVRDTKNYRLALAKETVDAVGNV